MGTLDPVKRNTGHTDLHLRGDTEHARVCFPDLFLGILSLKRNRTVTSLQQQTPRKNGGDHNSTDIMQCPTRLAHRSGFTEC